MNYLYETIYLQLFIEHLLKYKNNVNKEQQFFIMIKRRKNLEVQRDGMELKCTSAKVKCVGKPTCVGKLKLHLQ